ncbi:hypothetical protein KBD71_04605 [Candidatus Woesebacteria bacterium]|nr:hypothetical protein [Candidatus Woesebacteria bacterium]
MPDGEGGQRINGGLTQQGVKELHEAEIDRVDNPLRQQEAQIAETYNDAGTQAKAKTGGEFGLQSPIDYGADTSHMKKTGAEDMGTDRRNFSPKPAGWFARTFLGRK